MSIAMDRFGSDAQPDIGKPGGSPSSTFPYRLQCRACSFEPTGAIIQPVRCPKCASGAWERFAIPRSLLLNVDRRANDRRESRQSSATADAR
jgi:hypothetical protein